MKKSQRTEDIEVEYRVVETSDVTDITLEQLINKNIKGGWTLENVLFAMRESSKRPAMAFILFTKRKKSQ